MTLHRSTVRQLAAPAARLGMVVSAAFVAISSWVVLSTALADAAGVNQGAAEVVQPAGTPSAGQPLGEGGSATSFSLKLPAGAACAADGNNGGRWHTYMIPGTENPGDIMFSATGSLVGQSTGSGGNGSFRNNIYSASGVPVRGQAPNLGDAAVINIPNMRFSVWSSGNIPPGTYNIGIACVDLDMASAVDNFWNAQLRFDADAQDPVGVTWVALASTPATTTTSTTATTVATTTTTLASTSTSSPTIATTTTASPTVTPSAGGTPPSTVAAIASSPSSGTPASGGGAPAGTGDASVLGAVDTSSSEDLAFGGSNTALLVVSSVLLLICGRMAILLGRPIHVVDR